MNGIFAEIIFNIKSSLDIYWLGGEEWDIFLEEVNNEDPNFNILSL